jgi:predicted SnoaL-like aldol condensation-catalyzing enzyme
MKKTAIIGALVLLGTTGPASTHELTQLTSYAMNAQERANLQLVHDWWRDIMQGENLDIATHYMPAEFVSRNPNVATGREAFLETRRRRPDVFPNRMLSEPEVQFAKNEYVVLMWAHFVTNANEPAHIYKYNTMDMFRIDDGRIVEHWDTTRKMVEASLDDKGQGVYREPANLSAREQEARRIAIVELKDILQYGHTELALEVMAPGYIQHNPNVPGGRANFVKAFSNRESRPIQEEWRNPHDLILTSGNFVLFFSERLEEDPGDASRMTPYYRFDMVRVDDGLIQEHWDVAFPNGVER